MLIYAEYSCLKEPLSIFHIAGWSVTNTNEELCRGLLKKSSNSLGILTLNTLVHSNLISQSFTCNYPSLILVKKINLFFPLSNISLYFQESVAWIQSLPTLPSTHPEEAKQNKQHAVTYFYNASRKQDIKITYSHSFNTITSHPTISVFTFCNIVVCASVMYIILFSSGSSKKCTCWFAGEQNIIK